MILKKGSSCALFWSPYRYLRASLRAELASNSYRLCGLCACYKKWAPLFKFSYTCRFMLVQVQQVQTSEMGFCWCVQYSARLQAVVPKMNILSTTGKWSGLGFSLSCYLSSSQKWTFEVYIHYIGSWLSNTKGFDFLKIWKTTYEYFSWEISISAVDWEVVHVRRPWGCALGTHKDGLNWLVLAVYKLLVPLLCRKVF